VETISYFLKRYREDMIARKRKESEIDVKLAEFEARLRTELGVPQAATSESAGVENEREELQAVQRIFIESLTWASKRWLSRFNPTR